MHLVAAASVTPELKTVCQLKPASCVAMMEVCAVAGFIRLLYDVATVKQTRTLGQLIE
jgi:hypothetical protein